MEAGLEDLFRALADPTRREILARLAREPLPVHQVAAAFPATRPAISRHLRVLREAGLVRERRRGRERLYELEPGPLAAVRSWLASLGDGAAPPAVTAPSPPPAAGDPVRRRSPARDRWDWAPWARR